MELWEELLEVCHRNDNLFDIAMIRDLKFDIWAYLKSYDKHFNTNLNTLVEKCNTRKFVESFEDYGRHGISINSYRICTKFIIINNLQNKTAEEIVVLWKLLKE